MASALSSSEFQLILGKKVEVAYQTAPAARGTILLLHEALGSVSYWKDFPEQLCRATGYHVLSYSRPGHGNSEGPLEERNAAHYQRQVEKVIPALLAIYGISDPVLYGHSEGAAIAMLYSASVASPRALILESPHLNPDEEVHHYVQNLVETYPGSRLQANLAKYHRDADAVFNHWATWVLRMRLEDFFPRELLRRIQCPVQVFQGARDEFGTNAHLDVLRQYLPNLESHVFAEAGHLPHREQTSALIAQVAQFLSARDFCTRPSQPITALERSKEKP
ncbi:MAG: alpha/beta fold hydrolase [Acidobacteriaceae bacterium]